MRIAFIYDAAYPWITGGAEMRVYELAKRLSTHGHDVHWYTMGWWWDDQNKGDIIQEGIKYHGVCEPLPIYSKNRRSIKEAIYFSLKLLKPLMREHYDVVDCQGFPFFSSFIAWFHSLSGRSNLVITVLEVWGNYWYEYLGVVGFFGRVIEFLTLHLTNNLISISPKTKRDLQKVRKVNNIQIIPPGINRPEIIATPAASPIYNTIFAGRLIKEKRVDLLLAALEQIEDYEINCLIVGEGPEKESLEKFVIEHDLEKKVTFHKFMTHQESLISSMKGAKVLVLPSKREGFGMVVVEANACGIPVVITKGRMNAACDLIENGVNGFIAEPHSADMAKKIILALRNGDSMKDQCLKKSEEYDWDHLTILLEKYYQEIVL